MNRMVRGQELRILLVDDDEDLLELLKYNFRKDGFQVITVNGVRKAIPAAIEYVPELIVLDVTMPDGNGIDLCREIRGIERLKDTFVFFLSGCSSNTYRDQALQTGADDFIEKRNGLRVLTNKVNAVLKNKFVIKKGIPGLASDGLILDKKAEVVYLEHRELSITAPEFEILFFMMQNPNKVISRKSLIRIIWGSEIFVLDSSVQRYVENLQQKIGTKFIETVSSGRYRFVHTIRR